MTIAKGYNNKSFLRVIKYSKRLKNKIISKIILPNNIKNT
jgi:hypothetical protein